MNAPLTRARQGLDIASHRICHQYDWTRQGTGCFLGPENRSGTGINTIMLPLCLDPDE